MARYTPAGSARKGGSGLQTLVVVLVIAGVAVGGYFALRDKPGAGNSAGNTGQNQTRSGSQAAENSGNNEESSSGQNSAGDPEVPADIPGSTEFAGKDYQAAAAKLVEYVKANPDSPNALYMLGRCQLELGDLAAAEAALGQSVTLDAQGENGSAAALTLADALYAKYYANTQDQDRTKWERIRELYSIALRQMPYGTKDAPNTERKRVIERLNKLNDFLLWSKMLTTDSKLYTVIPGDSVEKIAVKHGIKRDCALSIARINKLKANNISVGQHLKIISPLSMEVVVSKKALKLTAYLNGYFFREYPVAVGKSGATPVGEFVLLEDGKDKNPDWTETLEDGTKKVWKFGDPKNILGTRWMGMKDRPDIGAMGLGIHGTTQPDSIGTYASAGCIRMLNENVEELYDFTAGGSKVTIVK